VGGPRKTFTLPSGKRARICRTCGKQKGLNTRNYTPGKRKGGRIVQWSYDCRPCAAANKTVEYSAKLNGGGEVAAKLRAERRRIQKNWRENNPEKATAAYRRYRDALKADPERHVPWLENRRIEHALRREREGRPVKRHPHTPNKGTEPMIVLPSGPLIAFIEGRLERELAFDRMLGMERPTRGGSGDRPTLRRVCIDLGVKERGLRRWQAGEQVSLDVAERFLIDNGIGWAEIWPPDEFPDLYQGILAGAV
jgi:hypothetical protein